VISFTFPRKVDEVMQHLVQGDDLVRSQRDLYMIVRRRGGVTALRLLHQLEACLYVA